jgi:hypothetical protein
MLVLIPYTMIYVKSAFNHIRADLKYVLVYKLDETGFCIDLNNAHHNRN